MSYLNNVESIIKEIFQQWSKIEEYAGDKWPELKPKLLSALHDVAGVETEKQAIELITEVLFIGYYSSAGSIFRQILGDYPLDEGLIEVSRKGGSLPANPADNDHLLESIKIDEGAESFATFKLNISETIAQLQVNSQGSIEIASKSRYLNAGFFSQVGEYVDPNIPLAIDRGPYHLEVNIGSFWGLGAADQSFPPPPDDLYDEDDILSLDVVARTQDDGLLIEPSQQTLILPKEGNSQLILLDLEIAQPGRFTIDVDVFYHGHLLQSRRTEFKVIQHANDELPESAWPVQDGYITFTRTALLTRETLAPLANAPRRLTVLAERDASSQNIGIRVYDNSGDSLIPRPSTLTDTNLTPLLNGLRQRLLETMNAYAGGIGAGENTLTKYMGQLAEAGHTFYRNLLPDARDANGLTQNGQRLQTILRPGDVVQIAPLSAQVSIPWELIYERPMHSYHESRTKLCTTFREHGPELTDCPHHNDAKVVCPHGFWGYRYIIEQLPCRVERSTLPSAQKLSSIILNSHPLHFTAITYDTGPLFTRHWQNLRQLATIDQLQLQQVDQWEDADAFFTSSTASSNLVYFYTHGGKNDLGQSYLQISDGSKFTINDLEAWRVNWHQMQPLVILNACESADYDPNDFENLILFFSQRGAIGVIGTQCEVKEKLADAFIIPFFNKFLRQMPVGEALFAARRQLLYDHLDPRGLVYSLFAAAEVKLAQPVLESEV